MPQQPAFARDNWFGSFAPPAPAEPAVEVDADRERDPEADTDEYDAVSETVEAERDSVVELPGQGGQARRRRPHPAAAACAPSALHGDRRNRPRDRPGARSWCARERCHG